MARMSTICTILIISCANDSIDPDIEAKLNALEEEEERLEAEGFYESDEEIVNPLCSELISDG
jgi:nucleolar GTP-binding protein